MRSKFVLIRTFANLAASIVLSFHYKKILIAATPNNLGFDPSFHPRHKQIITSDKQNTPPPEPSGADFPQAGAAVQQRHRLIGEQRGTENWENRVFVAGRRDGAGERATAVDDEVGHGFFKNSLEREPVIEKPRAGARVVHKKGVPQRDALEMR